MPLTHAAIRTAKPGEKPYNLFDERGLFLLVTPAGGKWWRLKYRFDGKEKLLSLGTWPDVGLKEARELGDEIRRQIAAGIDPSEAHKAATTGQEANSFEVVAMEWHAKRAPGWAASHAVRILRRFEADIFPWIGSRPVGEITAPELLAVVRCIEERGALETAHRALQSCGQVFRYAVATGRATRDPTGDLRGVLTPVKEEHFPAITDPAKVGELPRANEGYRGTLPVRCALHLAPPGVRAPQGATHRRVARL